jgi:methionyl-tRNA formyltransferase
LTVKALVRASNPTYGGAITFFRGVPVHILQVSLANPKNPIDLKAGTITQAGASGIIVASSDKKLVRFDVVYTEDGFFTGAKLATTFDIKANEEFVLPPMPPNEAE